MSFMGETVFYLFPSDPEFSAARCLSSISIFFTFHKTGLKLDLRETKPICIGAFTLVKVEH